MDEQNSAADSGLDTGYAGGETSTQVTQPPSTGLSLRDSLAKAATSVKERTSDVSPAREAADGNATAFEANKQTQPRSLNGQNGSQEEPASSIPEAPKHWPQKRRDAFGRFMAQNPEATAEWLAHTKELEGEFTRKSQEHAQTRQFADSVRELFTPEHRAVMQASNMDEKGAIKWLLQVDGYARKDPAGYAKWFMQQAGLTPQQLFPELGQGATPQADAEWQDPEIVKLREELGSLKAAQQQQLQRQEAYLRSQQEAQQQQHQHTINSAIEAFASSADESGNPLHPHFQEVEERMAWEFQNNPELKGKPVTQEALKLAYDVAVWANPSTRQAMLDAQQAAQQGDLARRQAADKARAAQTLKPKIGSAAGVTAVPPSDLKGLIRAAASRARG